MPIHSTVKRFAASTAVAGVLSVAGLGLTNGTAAAAPGDDAGSVSGSTGSSEQHPQQSSSDAPKPATGGDDAEVHAHLVPGYTPEPANTHEVHAHLVPGYTPEAAIGTGNSTVPPHLIPKDAPQALIGVPAPGQTSPYPGRYGTPDNPTCDSPGCEEIVDE